MQGIIVQLAYILAAIMFIYGLKQLSRVRTARGGNGLAALAMLIAIVVTMVEVGDFDITWLAAAMVIGSLIGYLSAKYVQMTSMPEMVAVFNGFGGAASTLVALSVLYRDMGPTQGHSMVHLLGGQTGVTVLLSIIIGSVTFSGSMIAFAKLKGLMTGNPILFKGQNFTNLMVALLTLALSAWGGFVTTSHETILLAALVLTALTLILGVLLVIPIGGADMPVVISLLNSYSGLAGCAAGFVVNNNLLIIAGSLVGASGLILTNIMCKAMNRSLANVLFGGFGGEPTAAAGKDARDYKNIKEYGPEDAAMVMESAQLVIIVPGYGLAVAQAQHACKELGDELEKRGCTVKYAIHPVAGRMPGHMNVLLAEADVSYDKLVEMDDINPEFKKADVALVLGANDVVNPAAINDPASPIAGMPILNVFEAQSVMVVKRSLSPGFAGIKNELFDYDNTLMIFGDAKKVLQDLLSELRSS